MLPELVQHNPARARGGSSRRRTGGLVFHVARGSFNRRAVRETDALLRGGGVAFFPEFIKRPGLRRRGLLVLAPSTSPPATGVRPRRIAAAVIFRRDGQPRPADDGRCGGQTAGCGAGAAHVQHARCCLAAERAVAAAGCDQRLASSIGRRSMAVPPCLSSSPCTASALHCLPW